MNKLRAKLTPMLSTYEQKLERNIVKYSWYKIFTKRVYLPLITIQLVNVGRVTLHELALIVIVSSIVQAVLQMPAGYFADKWGNRKSIILGTMISVWSPLFYVFMPNFMGGLVASVLFFGGYAFQSGALEAFIHDTLVELKREKDYARVMGRAQTYGLVGNILLITMIPATYAINHNLPFILGFLSLVVMVLLAVSFTYPNTPDSHATSPRNPLQAMKSIVTAENVFIFVFAGFLAGVSNKGGEFRELMFQDIGIPVAVFGILLAIGSTLGALFGWYVHILDRLKAMDFYLLDLVVIAGSFVLIGSTRNQIVAVIGFTIFAAYTRVRLIIFQAKLLHELQHAYKATLISALNVFTVIGDTLAITLLAQLVTRNGYQLGHFWYGWAILVIGMFMWITMQLESKYRSQKVK